jgi:hypothetical protein
MLRRQAGQSNGFAAFRGFRFQAANRRAVACSIAEVPNEAVDHWQQREK